MMHLEHQIADFLAENPIAVAGASTNRSKYGNMVLRCYLQNGRSAIPVNPHTATVEGLTAVPTLSQCEVVPHAVSIITPPDVTESIVQEALELGIQHLWMQPGAESDAAVAACQEAGINLISGGPCLLVVLGFRNADA